MLKTSETNSEMLEINVVLCLPTSRISATFYLIADENEEINVFYTSNQDDHFSFPSIHTDIPTH